MQSQSLFAVAATLCSLIVAAPTARSTHYTGADLTQYDPAPIPGAYGSCGYQNTNSQSVVAVAADMMNKATMCGKSITIKLNGKTHVAEVVDTCPGCSGDGLDLSLAAWNAVTGNQAPGRIHGAEWWFN